MSRSRALVSLFIVFHVAALTIGAVPDPEALPRFNSDRPTPHHPIGAAVAPKLDAAVVWFSGVHRNIWKFAQYLGRPTAHYRAVFGLAQRWAMFTSPSRSDEYLRIRYYVSQDGSTRELTSTELVMPAHREDRVRLVRSFRDSYFDKAVDVALNDFVRRRDVTAIRPDTRPTELPDDLVPFVNYFTRRFEREHLGQTGERIVRTEIWHGVAPNPSPNEGSPRGSPEERLYLLKDYYAGPVMSQRVGPRPPYHGLEREGDIAWVLEYFADAPATP